MDNFIFYNPTRLIFGKGMIAQLSQQIPANKRIMITFGGGSVKTNGVYEQVIQALEGRDYTEFWGIESNPDISTLKKAIESGKEKNIDFLLAVGGGSVIDGTKLISAGIPYDGDAWELVKKGSAQNLCIHLYLPNKNPLFFCKARSARRLVGMRLGRFRNE